MACQKPYSKRQSDVMYNALRSEIGAAIEDTYTQEDIDQLLAGYSPTGHTHPYSPDTHNHDADYSPTGHTHPYSPDTHNHDGAYYLKGEVDYQFTQNVPVGMVLFWPGSYLDLPDKWMYMDGSFLDSNTYTHLFALIGYTYGQSGSLFALPNAGGRMILGSPNIGGIWELGWTGGQSDVTLTEGQMPSHEHLVGHSAGQMFNVSLGTIHNNLFSGVHGYNANSMSTGGGQAHTNMPPYLCLFAVIKVLP